MKTVKTYWLTRDQDGRALWGVNGRKPLPDYWDCWDGGNLIACEDVGGPQVSHIIGKGVYGVRKCGIGKIRVTTETTVEVVK